YIEHLQLCTDLADWSSATVPISVPYRAFANGVNGQASGQPLISAAPEEHSDNTKLPPRRKQQPLVQRWSWFQPRLNWGVAAATILIALIFGWFYLAQSNSNQLKKPDSLGGMAATGNPNGLDAQDRVREGKFVARIVEVTSDARWDDNLHPREFLMRLRE